MKRRAIVECTHESGLVAKLFAGCVQGVTAISTRDCFDRNCVEVLVESPIIPVVRQGASYPRAVIVDSNGKLTLQLV